MTSHDRRALEWPVGDRQDQFREGRTIMALQDKADEKRQRESVKRELDAARKREVGFKRQLDEAKRLREAADKQYKAAEHNLKDVKQEVKRLESQYRRLGGGSLFG